MNTLSSLSGIRYSRLLEASYKTETWVIILLVVLNITLRLPTTPHPLGVDTYKTIWETKEMMNSHEPIVEHGPWVIRKRVFTMKGIQVGLSKGPTWFYPFSDPILYQLNYAILHQITSLDLELCLLLISILCGVLGLFSVYVMAREFVENKLMVYVIAFSFSISPVFLYITTWQGSFRMLFAAILPIVFWCFFKFNDKQNRKFLFFSLYLAFALVFVHRMSLMLPLVFAAFLAAYAYTKFFTFISGRISFVDRFLPYVIPITYVVLFIILLVYPLISQQPFFKNLRYEYATGMLTEGFQTPRIILNMSVDYFQNEGVLMILGLVGFIILVEKLRRPVKNINYLIVAFSLLFFLPFLMQGEYMTLYTLVVISVVISLGFKGVLSFIEAVTYSLRLNYNFPQIFVIGSIVISVLFSIFISYRWIETSPISYIKITNYIDETTIAAVEFINAIPDRVLIPGFINLLVHFSARTENPNQVDMGWENYGWSLHTIQNTLYLLEGNITHAIEYEPYHGSWVGGSGGVEASPLLKDLIADRDKIYSNGAIGVWESRPDIKDIEKYKDQLIQYKGYFEEVSGKVWFGGV